MGLELGFATPYDIIIQPSANKGFIVKVGCATLVAETRDKLISGIEEYLKDPKDWEKKYSEAPGRSGSTAEAPRPRPPSQEGLATRVERAR